MASTATARTAAPKRRTRARSAPARRQPARRPPARKNAAPARRRAQQTPIVGFVPVAVGRTAGAVGGLADSGLVLRLTRGRLWIGLLGALLVGIVALNVMALSFSSASSSAGTRADELIRQNSALRTQIATNLSSEQVAAEAAKLGLVVPNAGAIRYLHTSPGDAAAAAKRLRDGALVAGTAGTGYVTPAETSAVAPPVTTPAEAVPADPAVSADPALAPAPETTDPAAAPATAAPPTAPASEPAATGGGLAAP